MPVLVKTSQHQYFSVAATIIPQSNTKLKHAYRILLEKGRKFIVHKTFRRRPGHLVDVLCTLNSRPVSMGSMKRLEYELIMSVSQKSIAISDPAIIFTLPEKTLKSRLYEIKQNSLIA